MSSRIVVAYAVWIGSFALFVWLATLPGGSTFIALVASLVVLSRMHRWVAEAGEPPETDRPWRP